MADLPSKTGTTTAHAEFFTPEYLARRRRIMEQQPGPEGMDNLDPKTPAEHAYAFATQPRRFASSCGAQLGRRSRRNRALPRYRHKRRAVSKLMIGY